MCICSRGWEQTEEENRIKKNTNTHFDCTAPLNPAGCLCVFVCAMAPECSAQRSTERNTQHTTTQTHKSVRPGINTLEAKLCIRSYILLIVECSSTTGHAYTYNILYKLYPYYSVRCVSVPNQQQPCIDVETFLLYLLLFFLWEILVNTRAGEWCACAQTIDLEETIVALRSATTNSSNNNNNNDQ